MVLSLKSLKVFRKGILRNSFRCVQRHQSPEGLSCRIQRYCAFPKGVWSSQVRFAAILSCESWENLSRRQQVRVSIPSRILVSVFATQKRSGEENLAEAKRTKTSIPDDVLDNHRSTELEGDKGESISPRDIIGAEKTTADLQKPKINPVTHGPLFPQLPSEVQTQVKRIH